MSYNGSIMFHLVESDTVHVQANRSELQQIRMLCLHEFYYGIIARHHSIKHPLLHCKTLVYKRIFLEEPLRK